MGRMGALSPRTSPADSAVMREGHSGTALNPLWDYATRPHARRTAVTGVDKDRIEKRGIGVDPERTSSDRSGVGVMGRRKMQRGRRLHRVRGVLVVPRLSCPLNAARPVGTPRSSSRLAPDRSSSQSALQSPNNSPESSTHSTIVPLRVTLCKVCQGDEASMDELLREVHPQLRKYLRWVPSKQRGDLEQSIITALWLALTCHPPALLQGCREAENPRRTQL